MEGALSELIIVILISMALPCAVMIRVYTQALQHVGAPDRKEYNG